MDFDIFQTKQELNALIEDFKRFNTVFRFVSLGVYLTYLVYALIANVGFLALNIFLLCITALYTAFCAVCTVKEAKGAPKSEEDKKIAKLYRNAKFYAMVLSAVLSIIGILTAVEKPTPLSIVLAILLPVCLVLQAIFDLCVVWITVRVNRFQVAITQDFEMLKRDILKIAFSFVKDSIFKRNKDKDKGKDKQQEGGDIPTALEAVKADAGEKKANPVKRLFQKIFSGKKEKTAYTDEIDAPEGSENPS